MLLWRHAMSKTIFEEIKVTGKELLSRVWKLIKEGNVRRIVIKNEEGDTLFDMPLNVGMAGFGLSVLALGPIITSLGLFALFMNDYNVIVERTVEGDEKTPPKDENEVDAEIIDIEDSSQN